MTRLRVSIAATGGPSDRQRTVLATLPRRFAVGDEAADIVLVDGGATGGHDDAAGRAIFVDRVAAMPSASRPAGGGTTVAYGLELAPRVPVGSGWSADDPPLIVVGNAEVAAAGAGARRQALLELLALLRRLGDPALSVAGTRRTAGADIVSLDLASGAAARLVARHSFRERMSLEAATRAWRRTWRLDGSAPARPLAITRADARGSHTAWPLYEDGQRATWIALHAALTGGAGDRLIDVAGDLALLDEALPPRG